MKPKGSLLCLQVPYTCPILSQSNPVHAPHPTSWRSILILSSHLCWVFRMFSFFKFPYHHPVCTSPLPIHATYPACLILLVLITQIIFDEEYSSLSSSLCGSLHSPCYLIPLRLKHSPQHSILKHPQSTFPHCQHPTFTPIYNEGKIIVLCFLHLYILEQKTWRQKILCRMVVSIPWL
jgi:hypothetical protein